MKTTMLVILMAIIANGAFAQSETAKKEKTHVSLEIDPATFAFKGYSAHIRVQPKTSEHLLLGAGVYAMDMPATLVDMNKENADLDWKVRINLGTGLFTEYYFKEVNSKFFTGFQLSTQEFKIENESLSGSSKYINALLMGYGGYALKPFSFPLYFKFWGGLGYTSKIKGENVIEGKEYDIAPITFFGTLHIGYTF